MNKSGSFCLYVLLAILIAILVSVVCLFEYLECNPLTMGGTGSRPEHCSAKEKEKERARKKKIDMKKKIQLGNRRFICVHEKCPLLPLETQQLYDYALYQELHNLKANKRNEILKSILPYYRIAAANNDYKANIRLQYLLESKWRGAPFYYEEVKELNNKLVKQRPATAYYRLGGDIDAGFGIIKEKDGEYVYLRKAADFGSRDAQYKVASMLVGIGDDESAKEREFRLDIIEQLLICSSEQGSGDAFESLGYRRMQDGNYIEALRFFHEAIRNGNSFSAYRLSRAFNNKIPKMDEREYLGLDTDPERAARYSIIYDYLSDNEHLNPKVPDLDEIVPLPPAPLPAWDGKIAFQRWYEGTPPAKPSDELMQKLAEQAGLDVNTGLPLKKSK